MTEKFTFCLLVPSCVSAWIYGSLYIFSASVSYSHCCFWCSHLSVGHRAPLLVSFYPLDMHSLLIECSLLSGTIACPKFTYFLAQKWGLLSMINSGNWNYYLHSVFWKITSNCCSKYRNYVFVPPASEGYWQYHISPYFCQFLRQSNFSNVSNQVGENGICYF